MVMLKKFETQKVKALFILCSFLFFILFPISNFFSSQDYSIDYSKNKDQGSSLNTSSSWMNTSLTIDATASSNSTHYGNWNWAVDQSWCSGLGTYQFPYIIEFLSLSIGSAEYGLSIQNSRNVYFKLINVSAHGAIDEDEKGFYITNSTNGVIQNCNFTQNYYGIYMYYDCDNFTIVENDVSRCTSGSTSPIYTPRGIFLENDCDFNTIVNNTANQDGSRMDDGIYLLDYCDNNSIINNEINDVDISSVYLRNYCTNNTIHNNTLTGSLYGVDMYDFCSGNELSDNYGIYNSYGIRMQDDCFENQILNNRFNYSSNRGIYLWYSYNNTIVDNELKDTGYYGIDISYWSNKNEIVNNTIEGVSHGGIFISGSSDNYVADNTMLDCGIYVSGSSVERTTNFIYPNNTANGKPIYYYAHKDGLDNSDFTNAAQIILVNCTNSDIISLYFDNVTVGIQLLYTSYSNILLNTIKDCTNGFYQEGGQQNQIVLNDFSSNIAGITLEGTDFNNVSLNTVDLNGNYGIWIGGYSENNTVYDNTGSSNGLGGLHIRNSWNNTCYDNSFTGSSRGIELLSADQNYILHNRIWAVQFGFLLQMGCEYNVFKWNNITGAFGPGVQLSSSSYNEFYNNIIMSSGGTGFYISNSNSYNNTISHNAFLTNNIQGQDSGTYTKWTRNSIGNYWDDYTGNDTNSDGIGDTPYFINPNGIDDRPLMDYPFTGDPPTLPELFLYDYILTNSSLTLTVKNSGEDNATGITLLVEIESLPLNLYNNSLTPFDLEVEETGVIFIDLTNFYDNFTWGVNYSIRVIIDPENEIVEENELNNEIELDFHYRPDLTLPDLIVENYTLTAAELWVNVNNTGDNNATAVVIYSEIESLSLTLYNNSLSPADIDINKIFEVYVNLSDYKHLFTAGETYNITIRIDPHNSIEEKNESNNILILEYTYRPFGPLPDLLIQNHLLFNNSLTFAVKNNGTSDANMVEILVEIDSIPLILYNNSLNLVNISVDGTLQINITLLDFQNDFSNNTVYHIKIWVDYYDVIAEFDETNNDLSIFYNYVVYDQPPINLPDLVFQSYSLDSDSLTLVILNNGTEIATDIVLIVRINSLSLTLFNDTITPLTLGVDETTSTVINLTDFFDWFNDGEIYSITARIDPLNTIEEISEINNQLDINFIYQEEETTPRTTPSVPWISEFLLATMAITIAFLIIRIKKHKFKQF